MLEVDLKTHIETILGMTVYPIKIPQNATLPAVVYSEIQNSRNSDSSLKSSNLRNKRYQITVVSPDSEVVILAKEQLIYTYEGFSGMLGNSNIFIARISSALPLFDNKQQNFEYNVDITFTQKLGA